MSEERIGATAMNDFKELKVWIERNQERFTAEKYAKEDIARLAIACGFNRSAVAQWQTQKRFKQVA
jgi:hypothetical protein